jgi:hypothetical protein
VICHHQPLSGGSSIVVANFLHHKDDGTDKHYDKIIRFLDWNGEQWQAEIPYISTWPQRPMFRLARGIMAIGGFAAMLGGGEYVASNREWFTLDRNVYRTRTGLRVEQGV